MDPKEIRKAPTQEELARRTFERLKHLVAVGRTDSRSIIENVLDLLIAKQVTRDEAVAVLVWESGRGGRIIVVDETIEWIEGELSARFFTTELTARGADSAEIKKELRSRVFITRNGSEFSDPAEMRFFRYGLVWIQTENDDQLADRVEAALRTSNFGGNLVQVVRL